MNTLFQKFSKCSSSKHRRLALLPYFKRFYTTNHDSTVDLKEQIDQLADESAEFVQQQEYQLANGKLNQLFSLLQQTPHPYEYMFHKMKGDVEFHLLLENSSMVTDTNSWKQHYEKAIYHLLHNDNLEDDQYVVQLQMLLAHYLEQVKQFDEAIQIYNQLISSHETTLSKDKLITLIYNRALLMANAKQFENAKKEFESILQMDSSKTHLIEPVLSHVNEVLQELPMEQQTQLEHSKESTTSPSQKLPSGSSIFYKNLLKIFLQLLILFLLYLLYSTAQVSNYIATLYLAFGKIEEAEEVIEEALEVSPDYLPNQILKIKILLLKRGYAKVLELCNQLLATESLKLLTEEQESELHAMKGAALYYLENIKEAFKELNISLELNPNTEDYTIYWLRSMIYMSKRLYVEALEDIQDAIQLFENQGLFSTKKKDIELYYVRAVLIIDSFKQPLYTTAIQDLTLCLNENPRIVQCLLNRALLYERMYIIDKALEDVNLAETIIADTHDPSYNTNQQYLTALRKLKYKLSKYKVVKVQV